MDWRWCNDNTCFLFEPGNPDGGSNISSTGHAEQLDNHAQVLENFFGGEGMAIDLQGCAGVTVPSCKLICESPLLDSTHLRVLMGSCGNSS